MRRNLVTMAAGCFVIASAGGCSQNILASPFRPIDSKPGLADVRVLGPKGQQCYDFCAVSHSNCHDMCPRTSNHEDYDCADDCVSDSKVCLEDCPELQRPPKKK